MTQRNTSKSIIRNTKRELKLALKSTILLIEKGLLLVLVPIKILKKKDSIELKSVMLLLKQFLTYSVMNVNFVVKKISTFFKLTILTEVVANTLKALTLQYLATTRSFLNLFKIKKRSIGLFVQTAISGRELGKSIVPLYGIFLAESFFKELLK